MARAAQPSVKKAEVSELSDRACDRCGSEICLALARGAAARNSTLVADRVRHFADPAAFGQLDTAPNVCPATGRARSITL